MENLELGQLLGVHVVFICIGLLALLLPLPTGVIFLAIVIFYNVGLPLLSFLLKRDRWLEIFWYSLGLSLLQVIPDWVLSAALDVLYFPPDGLFKIGTVAGYMWGLWTVPFVVVIATGVEIHSRTRDLRNAVGAAGLVGFVIFTVSELTLWRLGSWTAVNVATTGHVAHYILLPELFLSMLTYAGFELTRSKSFGVRIIVTVLTMICYTGMTAISLLFFEVV